MPVIISKKKFQISSLAKLANDKNPTNGNDTMEPPTVQQVRRSGSFRDPRLGLEYEHPLTDNEDAGDARMFFVHDPASYRDAVEGIDTEKWHDTTVEEMGAPETRERGNSCRRYQRRIKLPPDGYLGRGSEFIGVPIENDDQRRSMILNRDGVIRRWFCK